MVKGVSTSWDINSAHLNARHQRSVPCIDGFELWQTKHRRGVPRKSPLGEALRYIARFWDGLILFLSDSRIAMDNNTVERTIRPIALNQKSALFASHYTGAQNWGIITSLIVSTKLNKIEQLLLWKHTAEINLV